MKDSSKRDEGAEPVRILLYSHDSYGLGHLRRNLTLASALVEGIPGASVLIATGSPCATFFPCPDRVEVVKLPSVTKDEDGAYMPRSMPGSLSALLLLRRRLLLETFLTFDPRLFLVDHQVVGLHGEILPLLQEARRRGTRTILGVRDVIDAPEVVAREWGQPECRWALAQAYDRICVYGTPEVFDPRREYPIPPELGARLEFTGYVVHASEAPARRAVPSLRRSVLVTMGGGEDGPERIDAYIDALAESRTDCHSVIVGGPLMDNREARRIKRRARLAGGVEFHRSHADVPRLVADADAVVSMAGYNTCAELLASGKSAVLLPRTRPRLEQRIRAERLARLGLCQSLVRPTAVEFAAAIERALSTRPDRTHRPCLDGAARLASIAADLCGIRTSSARERRAARSVSA
jgi:predicted glycosyltransferase